MRKLLRSKQGCWTCRLRRKKCDEKKPNCGICDSLSITCYGYGEKPDWMDDGEKEKEMAHSIKQIVKITSRRKGRTEPAPLRAVPESIPNDIGGHAKIAPKTKTSAENRYVSPESDIDLMDPYTSRPPPAVEIRPLGGGDRSSPTSSEDSGVSWSSPGMSNGETALLMHFLDNVFPMQYPLYNPGAHEGGRGWLFSLMLRTPPLYHASLALAAYHRRVIVLSEDRDRYRKESVDQQEKHIASSLKEFQRSLKGVGLWMKKNVCPLNSLGLMASTVQLIFFELFAGQDGTSPDAWKIHLQSGTNLFRQNYYKQLRTVGLNVPVGPDADKYKIQIEIGPAEDVVILTFFCGSIVWLDILSSITTGTAPRLQPLHKHMSSNGILKLETIMGSRNWAMFEIGHVSALHEFMNQGFQKGCLNTNELDARANDIREEIQHQLAAESLDTLGIADEEEPAPHAVITKVFALTALIYLHLIIHGFQNPTPELDNLVEEAMKCFKTHMRNVLMRVTVCPLFIIGCVASEDSKSFFRSALASNSIINSSLKHRKRLLPLLEDIWRRRESPEPFVWQDFLDMTGNDLLLL